jgi:hypothetical protein
LALSGCLYAPAEEGYLVRAPPSGPSKLAPDGFAWKRRDDCTIEQQRDVYNSDTSVVRLCDWVLVRAPDPIATSSAAPTVSAAPPGCTKDTDCKGDRICVADRCADPG